MNRGRMFRTYRPRHAHRGRYATTRRRRLAAAFATATAMFAAGCSASDESRSGGDYTPSSSKRTVLYEVEGTADGASLTMSTPTGTRQVAEAAVPVKRKESGERGVQLSVSPGTFVYVSAQNNGDTGTISCRITVDGVVISENSSSGGYAIATCEGSA